MGAPRFFILTGAAVGPIVWDLAAHAGNTVCGDRYFGPGSRWGEDSLKRAWDWLPGVPRDGLRWLNYPFGDAPRWMSKVASEATKFNVRIAVLGPADIAPGFECWRWGEVEQAAVAAGGAS